MERADLSSLSIFAAVARKRSFRAAAKELRLSPSAVSHAIGMLEDRLGVRLLARTTRSVAATEAGQRLLERLEPALAEIGGAVEELAAERSAPAGTLRITLPRTATKQLILPLFAAFSRAYPAITLDLRSEDKFIDIVAEGFDAGLRFGESIEKDMIAVRFGPRQRMIAVAAPTLLAGRKPPFHPGDLAAFPCIALRLAGGALYRWEFEKAGELLEVAVEGPLVLNDSHMVIHAAMAGIGIGFVFEATARAALERGELIEVLGDWCPSFSGFFLYYPSRRQMRPALRAFIDFFTRT